MRRLALVALLLLLPPVSAQETTPVLVERTDGGKLVADLDHRAIALFEITNLNPEVGFFVSVNVIPPSDWAATIDAPGDRDGSVERAELFLDPGNATRPEPVVVTVSFWPTDTPRAGGSFDVTFRFVHRETGAVTKSVERVEVGSSAPPKVLDLVHNPLPPPLDNAYGTFLLEAGFWALIAILSIFVGDAIVRSLTARADNLVTREILSKLRRPIFYFVFALGVSRSFAVLPSNPFTEFVRRTFLAVAIGIFGLYVVYRILDSVLLYYQKEISPRTATNVDDVLIPVVRRVGTVVLWIVGIIISLRTLGWDPTIIFAGAGIAGLVIAFAAQDSLSNLFSGIFLMVDQPFKEGDPITMEGGETAIVQSVGLRTTRLYSWRMNEVIIVPNNQLASKRVVNHAGPELPYWVWLDVGVAYGSDPEKVRDILLRVAGEHPEVEKRGEYAPQVRLKNFGESALEFQLRFAAPAFRGKGQIASDLRFAIRKAFREAGIEIPFPQRTVWLKQAA